MLQGLFNISLRNAIFGTPASHGTEVVCRHVCLLDPDTQTA